MYIGFIPVLVAFVAVLTSIRARNIGRILWVTCAVLVVIWTLHHGAHHLPDLKTLGSW
jgi:hypothetical protein